MITYVKKSKLKKVDSNFFVVVKISMERTADNELSLPYIIPPASILLPRMQGNIGKKKFLKKYRKYLENSKAAEVSIYNLMKALKQKTSLCFTCTDDEYKLGYIQEFCDYLASVIGCDFYSYKDASEMLENELEGLSKKQRKLIGKDADKLSSKEAKLKKKFIKDINKSIRSQFGEDGLEYYNMLDKELAVDQIVGQSVNEGILKYDKKGAIVIADESKVKDTRPYVTAILLTGGKKPYKKIVKSVLESNNFELKKKALKKLSTSQVVMLCVQILRNISEYRENETSNK